MSNMELWILLIPRGATLAVSGTLGIELDNKNSCILVKSPVLYYAIYNFKLLWLEINYIGA